MIPNAVDESEFAAGDGGASARRRHGLERNTIVGYVGAINRWRRLDLLVDAFARVAPSFPAVHLLVVGDGPDRGAAARQAGALGIADRVCFAGAVPHEQVASYIAAFDVAVLPHSNVYGSPMKLFEYMAAGRSVVAPRLPPIVPVLGDSGEGEVGVVFTSLDAGGLSSALAALLGDKDLRDRLGGAARARARREYVWSRHGILVEDLAERLGADRAPAPTRLGGVA